MLELRLKSATNTCPKNYPGLTSENLRLLNDEISKKNTDISCVIWIKN